MSVRKLLVTGATGLVGHEVCTMLRHRGYEVVPCDVTDTSPHELGPIAVADLRDVHTLYTIIDETIDAIVHCGGFSGPMHGWSTPHHLVDVNITGTENLLEIARRRGIERFVYASTALIYGTTDSGPVNEEAPMRPVNIYAATKVAGDSLVRAYREQFQLDATSIRLGWVYGPRRTTDCVMRDMITDALQGEPTRWNFGKDFPRQFIAVEDAAQSLIQAALIETPLPKPAYNATGGNHPTLEDVANYITEVVPGADISLAPGPDPTDVWQHPMDLRAAKEDLEFEPEVSLKDGVRKYAEYLRSKVAENIELPSLHSQGKSL